MKLVTGAGGFIGKALTKGYGKDAIALSRSVPSSPGASLHTAFDLTKTDQLDDLVSQLQGYGIDEIIHTAAITPWSPNPDFSLDIAMAETLVGLCNTLQVPRLTFLSGWIVYDMSAGDAPFDETTPLGPNTPYGQSKLAIERYFTENLQGTVVVNVRLASVYGPGQMSSGLIPNFTGAALQGKELSVGSRDTRRDYLFIDDLVRQLQVLSAIQVPAPTAINLGSDTTVTVLEVAQTLKQLSNKLYSKDITITQSSPQESRPINNQLDISTALSLGIPRPRITLEDGLEQYMKWRENL